MTRFISFAVALVILAAGSSSSLVAQRAAGPPPTYETVVLRTWKQLHDKILVMAKDTGFPDDKLSWRPHPDSRTVLDELRHVTIGLEMSSAQLRGEPFDYPGREKADAGKPKTRASMVAEMEAAIAESYALVEKSPAPSLLFWLDHQGEHYGKLVSNYRMIGIVPPISRR
jgi:hypothetical protein